MHLTRRRFLRTSGAALGAVASAGCHLAGGSGDATVEMASGSAFDPSTVTVDPGATVTWTNGSDVDHTVTASGDRLPEGAAYFASGGFGSEAAARADVMGGLVPPGDRYEHEFREPGTYPYYCVRHESSGVTGTVRVRMG